MFSTFLNDSLFAHPFEQLGQSASRFGRRPSIFGDFFEPLSFSFVQPAPSARSEFEQRRLAKERELDRQCQLKEREQQREYQTRVDELQKRYAREVLEL